MIIIVRETKRFFVSVSSSSFIKVNLTCFLINRKYISQMVCHFSTSLTNNESISSKLRVCSKTKVCLPTSYLFFFRGMNIKKRLATQQIINILTHTILYELYYEPDVTKNQNHFLFVFSNFIFNFHTWDILKFNKAVNKYFYTPLLGDQINPCYKPKKLEAYVYRHTALSVRIMLISYDKLVSDPSITNLFLPLNMDYIERFKTILEVRNAIKKVNETL